MTTPKRPGTNRPLPEHPEPCTWPLGFKAQGMPGCARLNPSVTSGPGCLRVALGLALAFEFLEMVHENLDLVLAFIERILVLDLGNATD